MKLGLVEPGVGRRQSILEDAGLLSGGGAGIRNRGQHDGHGQASCLDPWKLDDCGETPRERFPLPYRSPARFPWFSMDRPLHQPLTIWEAPVAISKKAELPLGAVM